MVEILETAGTQVMVYVTTDEKKLIKRLFKLKDEAAIYSKQFKEKRSTVWKAIGYHWLLSPFTVRKMFPQQEVVKIQPE